MLLAWQYQCTCVWQPVRVAAMEDAFRHAFCCCTYTLKTMLTNMLSPMSACLMHRYISEDFGGTALHPVDILSAADGSLLRQLTDANLTTISPVNKPHPRRCAAAVCIPPYPEFTPAWQAERLAERHLVAYAMPCGSDCPRFMVQASAGHDPAVTV